MKKKVIRKSSSKKETVVMASGGFDPIHIGHVRYFQSAKKLGDKLVVVVNNDNWIHLKKGKEFMIDKERKEIIEALGCVDKVFLSLHKKGTKDMSVCEDIKKIKPDIFANGGDRKPDGDPVPEVDLCKKMGIKMIYNVGRGGKVRSSSELIKNYHKR